VPLVGCSGGLAITPPQFNLSTTQTDCLIAIREEEGPTFVAT
jgi:hypothetical protein